MSHPHVRHPRTSVSSCLRGIRWWPLVAVTAVNYLWQVPYAVHQYGRRWDALAGLSIPLILTGVWFAIAMVATVGGRRGGRRALAAFLVTEIAFYAVHNASGAFAADLPFSNPVLLITAAAGSSLTASHAWVTGARRRSSGAPGPPILVATQPGSTELDRT
jgi:hypothetical protein